jgi:hypothetical protein
MVSTRNHPSTFPPPALSPSKGSSRTSDATKGWAHAPSNLALLWLIVSLPVVIWDTGYVLLRPYSMPGGSLHRPIWTLYDLYGRVDHMYGWPAFNARNGFTSAQATVNLLETSSYALYLYLVYAHGHQSHVKGRGAPNPSWIGWLGEARLISGPWGTIAPLIGFGTSLTTLMKTILYCESVFIGQG